MGGILCCKKRKEEEEPDEDDDDALDVEELLQEAVGDEKGAIELSISCKGLPDIDKFSRSDPFVVCHRFNNDEGGEAAKSVIGKTEVEANTLTPVYLTPIMVPYSLVHGDYTLIFEVYHEKSKDLEYYDQTFMGEFRVALADVVKDMGTAPTVGELVDNKNHVGGGPGLHNMLNVGNVGKLVGGGLAMGITGIKNVTDFVTKGGIDDAVKPTIQILATHAKNTQEKVILSLSGTNLRRPKSRLGVRAAMANYFVLISRVQGNNVLPVAKSTVSRQFMTKDTLQKGINPEWGPIHIKTFRLCGNDYNCPLLVQLYDMNYIDGSNHQLIGQGRTSLAIMRSGAVRTIPMINEKKTGQAKYVNSGEINVNNVKLLTSYGFLDYVNEGFEINCSIAIDFSASNGPKHRKDSLHFMNPDDPNNTQPSQYASAVREACKIIGRYDRDQMFPCYGFGAMLGDGKVSNCFPVSFDVNHVAIQGEDAIVEAYYSCLSRTIQMEPSCLAPVIKRVLVNCKENVRQNPKQPGYQFLIVLTDGDIDDLTETVDVLVECSYAPMSVLLIGIGEGGTGDERFAKIKDLIDPKVELRSVITGKRQKRPVVHFVPWKNYANKSSTEFARAALAKVPKHFLSWVEMSGFSLERIHDEEDFDLQRKNDESTSAGQTESEAMDIGEVREIFGLKTDQSLNGQTGRVLGMKEGACIMLLDDGRKLAVLPENLRPAHDDDTNSAYTPPVLSAAKEVEATKPYALTLRRGSDAVSRSSFSSRGSRRRSIVGTKNLSFRDMGKEAGLMVTKEAREGGAVNPYGPAAETKWYPLLMKERKSLRELVEAKDVAVKEEDYEKAADLKKEIDALGGEVKVREEIAREQKAEVKEQVVEVKEEKRILTPATPGAATSFPAPSPPVPPGVPPTPPVQMPKKVPYAPGSRVILQNFMHTPELNGLTATVVQLLSDTAIVVDVPADPAGERTVAPENVRLAQPLTPTIPLPRYVTSVRTTGLEV